MCKQDKIKNICKWAFVLFMATLQTTSIAIVSIYFGKLIEFIFITLGFGYGKAKFGKKTYHARTILSCTLLSMVIFGAACVLVPTTRVSIFAQGFAGVYIAWFMRWLDNKIDTKAGDNT